MPVISIVVPVYNSSLYLRECLDSILHQKFTDFEVVLVDDGSTDTSKDICREYESRDTRFKYVYQPNQGVSVARNTGISASSGDWLTFVDSDDEIEQDYLAVLYDNAMETGADLVISGCKYKVDGVLQEKKYVYKPEMLDKDHFFRLFKYHEFKYMAFVWGKLYRMSCVKGNLEFVPNVAWSEDSIFLYGTLEFVNKISLIDYCGYIYHMYNTSWSHKKHDFEHEVRGFNSMYDLAQKLESALGTSEIYDYINLSEFLKRSILSLYGVNLTKAERLSRLKTIKFKKRYIKYTPKNIKEKLFHWALINKCWFLVDHILS